MAEVVLSQLLSLEDLRKLDLKEIEILKMTVAREIEDPRKIAKLVSGTVNETLRALRKTSIRTKPKTVTQAKRRLTRK